MCSWHIVATQESVNAPRGTSPGGVACEGRCSAKGLGVLTRVDYGERISALRHRLGDTLGRLRTGALPIVQTAVATSLAWFLASAVLGHERPFFAPIAAVISLGLVVGQGGRRVRSRAF